MRQQTQKHTQMYLQGSHKGSTLHKDNSTNKGIKQTQQDLLENSHIITLESHHQYQMPTLETQNDVQHLTTLETHHGSQMTTFQALEPKNICECTEKTTKMPCIDSRSGAGYVYIQQY